MIAYLDVNGCMSYIICLCSGVCMHVYVCKCLFGCICIVWMILVCGCMYKYICVFDQKYVNVDMCICMRRYMFICV